MNKFNKIYQCFLDLIVHEVVIQKKSDTFFQHKLMDSVHLKSVRGIYCTQCTVYVHCAADS